MKTLVQNYTFSALSRTVTFTSYPSLQLENILLVTNVTANVILYSFAVPDKGGTVAGNVLTLAYDTSAMNSGDKLQIYYDDPNAAQTLAAGAYDASDNLQVTLATLLGGEDLANNVMGTLAKPVSSPVYAPLSHKNAGTVTKPNVKASPGNIYALRFTNANAAVRYLQLHNK